MTKRQFLMSLLCFGLVLLGGTQKALAADNTIKVGVLHSLSGTMAISESALKGTDAGGRTESKGRFAR